MPVGKSVVIMGGTLHGCELAEFLAKKGRRVVIAHDGPASELGDGMTVDDLENLWPWFKQKHVPIWAPVEYREIVEEGLKVRMPDKRIVRARGQERHAARRTGRPTRRSSRSFRRWSPRPTWSAAPGARADRGRRPRGRPGRLRDLAMGSAVLTV